MADPSPVVALCGDSHLTPTSRWNTLKLGPRLQRLGVHVFDLAVGGLNSRAAVARYVPPIEGTVILSLGGNDAAPWKQVSLDEFRENCAILARRFAPTGLVFVTPAPVREDRQIGRTNERIAEYATVIEEVAIDAQACVVSLFSALARRMANGDDVHAPDGVHLNNSAYDELEALILAAGVVSPVRRDDFRFE